MVLGLLLTQGLAAISWAHFTKPLASFLHPNDFSKSPIRSVQMLITRDKDKGVMNKRVRHAFIFS